MVRFIEENHLYTSDDNTKWESVTSIVKRFQEKFDADSIALKSSKNKKSKWYGMSPEEIKQCWNDISQTAIDLGNYYHKQQEKLLCSLNSIEREGIECFITKPIIENNIKYSPDQKLENNHIYPEHFVYLKSAGVCGQSDLVEVRNNRVYVDDYKSNKDLTTEGYKDWRGVSKKLLSPLSHLEDCKLSIYNIQLSIYMYIILKHNPLLEPGDLTIRHIIFKEIGEDRLGNRAYETDNEGNPIVDKVIFYRVPYLKDEVNLILNHLKSENSGNN
jgi:hypothetical protein